MTLIGNFLSGTYQVTRSSGGKYVMGRYEAGPTEYLEMRGSLQPTNAKELKLPEEGNRLRQYWKFYTDEPVVTDNTRTLGKSDVVQINGESYRVMSQETWQGFDLNYFMAILYREPEQ